ncbi:hypothetical protein [Paraflavitalea pollutisoli]|uniref:hypothetical protein n=1 Tax=Paraflavitalea pollutisoli TaxID=3034143 RepID=UPI0023ED8EB2|nr:hypothetical protein [Paraflavitalea sp. H1-2-19X]
MKHATILSYVAMMLIATCSMLSAATAQDSTSVKDTSVVVPFKDLPVRNINAIGNKKTGLLTISMEFVNNWKDMVEATIRCTEWADFGITTDKDQKYKVPTSSSTYDQEKENKGYKPVMDIQYGTVKLERVPILMQYLKSGVVSPLTIRIPGYDKTSKVIKEIHIRFSYSQFGAGGFWSEGVYQINQLAIDWK